MVVEIVRHVIVHRQHKSRAAAGDGEFSHKFDKIIAVLLRDSLDIHIDAVDAHRQRRVNRLGNDCASRLVRGQELLLYSIGAGEIVQHSPDFHPSLVSGVHIGLGRAHFHGTGFIKYYKPCGRRDIYGLGIGDPAGKSIISRRSGYVVPDHVHFAVQRRALILRLLIIRDRRHCGRSRLSHLSVLYIADQSVRRHDLAPVVHSLNDRHFCSR